MLRFWKSHKGKLCLFSAVIIMTLVLTACSAIPQPPPTPEASVVEPIVRSSIVVAEGRIIPNQYANLSFIRDGEIAEILVAEGANVKKGEVIARLKMDKSLEANVTLAEQALVDAQQGLDDVKKNENVDKARAFQAISDSSDALRKAQRMYYYYTVPSRVAVYSMFEAAEKMQERVTAARKAFEPYKDVLRDSTGLGDMPATFCIPASLCRGATMRSDDTPAVKLKKDLDDAEGDLQVALTQIRNAANMANAQAALDKAQRDSEKVQKGPDADKLAVAEIRLKKAQFQLEEAQKALGDLELRAPFDGVVAKIDIKVGELIEYGDVAANIVDYSKWIVETNNLTEIQVVKLDEGQTVDVVADALPGEVFKGTVENISDTYEDVNGDVTYKIKILLTDPSPKLRWGMTVVATFGSE